MRYLLLSYLIALTVFLIPEATFASAADLSPAITNLSKEFSEKFCTSINKGVTPEGAGQSAAAQLSPQLLQGFFFSPVMNELMSTPKEDLAASLSNNILNGCAKDLGGTQEELDDYLAQLINKIPSQTKGLNLPPVRQTEPLNIVKH